MSTATLTAASGHPVVADSQWIEARTQNRVARATLRLLFNPARTLSNSVGGKLPWHRRDRSLSWR